MNPLNQHNIKAGKLSLIGIFYISACAISYATSVSQYSGTQVYPGGFSVFDNKNDESAIIIGGTAIATFTGYKLKGTGSNAPGLEFWGASLEFENGANIETSGANSHGFYLRTNPGGDIPGAVSLDSSTIATSGAGAHAIYVENVASSLVASNMTVTSTQGGFLSFSGTGTAGSSVNFTGGTVSVADTLIRANNAGASNNAVTVILKDVSTGWASGINLLDTQNSVINLTVDNVARFDGNLIADAGSRVAVTLKNSTDFLGTITGDSINLSLNGALWMVSGNSTLGQLSLAEAYNSVSLHDGVRLKFSDSSNILWSNNVLFNNVIDSVSVQFGSDGLALTQDQLSRITVIDAVTGLEWSQVGINENGFLYQIPEPSSYAIFAGIIMLGLATSSRRRK
ncbi:MAG: hypothetical protein LBV12_05980 [Puniceicoccales bacterium]|nr:hypothetical protein [Puniceicoccales bacterium]